MTEAWVPDACTLPTAEQPLRIAEFDDLFASALRDSARPVPTRLTLVLDADTEARTRDLIRRESQCCSFFAFAIGRDGARLQLDIEVPESHVAVLDAIERRIVQL